MTNEEFAQRFADLVEMAEDYPPLSAGAKERAMAMRMNALPAQGRQRNRLLIYTVACLIIIGLITGGILTKPGDWKNREARSLLMSVANAMENIQSISYKYRFTPHTQDKWDSQPTITGSSYLYASPQEIYQRRWDKDGKLETAEGVNLAELTWWVYTNGTLYVADTTPVKKNLTRGMMNVTKMFTSPSSDNVWGMIIDTMGMQDPNSSVTTEQRNGREIKVLTFKGRFMNGIQRKVLEIDAQTNHLLEAHEYYQPDGKAEYESAVLEDVQYNMPAPADVKQKPAAAEQKKATMEEEKSVDHLSFFMMEAPGKQVWRINLGLKTPDMVTAADRNAAQARQAWMQKQMAEAAASPMVKWMDAEPKVQSIHYIYEPTAALQQMGGKAPGVTHRQEIWASDTAFYTRGLSGFSGKYYPAWGIDAQRLKWVVWDGKRLYVADLKPMAEDAKRFIRQFRDFGSNHAKGHTHMYWKTANPEDFKTQVSSGMTGNRKVEIETMNAKLANGTGITIRSFDAATHLLIDSNMYLQKTGGKKQLLATVTAEYDTPAPAELASMEYGKPVVPASATIENTNGVEMVMQAEGKRIDRLVVPPM
jgi:hypothetical protein